MKKLILVAPNPALCEEFRKSFAQYVEVEVVNDFFEKITEFDCMVSAANSFGLMDGGVDLAITRFFGWELQTRVQDKIIKEFRGEQPVGTSIIVKTNHQKHPFIVHTPTMRVPLPITRMDNVYKAMFAMLLAVTKHNEQSNQKINTVVCPGLGTATGKVKPREASRQMELAYRNFMNPPSKINWDYALKRQQEIIYGGDIF
ncbi:MAG: O-acetyl-ADP-ribose deacetylase (regulator of RNase III) [Bacteroidia bacterium]|jgi:O-acetyl-ADP-ribose deacetylase (regulator of RNase III)